MERVIILSILFIFSWPSYGQININFTKQSALNDHENPGCPINSQCSKSLGKIYGKWQTLIKQRSTNYNSLNKFLKNHGMPFSFWGINQPPKEESDSVLYYQSSCDVEKGKPPIQWPETFAKSTKDLLDKTQAISKIHKTVFHFDHIYALNGKKVLTYIVPRRNIPILSIGNELVFAVGKDGRYYQLKITPQGQFSYIQNIERDKKTENIDCPEELLAAFKSQKNPLNLEIEPICKSIWDQKNKKYKAILYPWSCR